MGWRGRATASSVTVALAFAVLAASAAAAAPGSGAVIRRTSHGIPHILASDYQGAGYGYGYAFAEDNICTMADSYATVRAQRSRFFGPDDGYTFQGNGFHVNNLNSDFFFQRINDNRTVESLVAQAPPLGPRQEVRDLVRGYVAGYNQYLRDTGVDRLPDPTCRGKPWVQPIDEIDAYRRFYQLALLASQGVTIDGIASAAPLTSPPGTPLAAGAPALQSALGQLSSNAYGLGREATDNRRGMLLGNPHFPWQGSERFYEAQLTIPGEFDVTGGSLFGVPLILIGHNDSLAWSHTVSTAYRFTPFEEKLVPGSPTTYIYDGQPRQMKADRVTVKVRSADGSLVDRTRTLYSTHHGPIFTSIVGVSLPWSSSTAYSMGDANAGNFRYLNHFFETDRARSVRELDQVLRRNQGIPWVNTIGADSAGEAYYADISVVPNVSNEQASRCNVAAGQATYQALRLPILEGSLSSCEWGNDPDARQPGTFGPSHLPSLFRNDYVTNSNDSYWLPNPKQPLTGFARIIGDEGTARSLRTRLGLVMVDQRLTGRDGRPGNRFTLQQLQDTVFNNRQYAGELFRDQLVDMCNSNPVLSGSNGPVDVSQACPVLARWNLHDDLDSNGAILFRRFAVRALASVGGVLSNPSVYATPFSASDPVNTPRDLNTSNPQVRQALADAVAELRADGIPLDAPLRGWQYEKRGDEKIPIHGGPGTLGVFNAINVNSNYVHGQGYTDVPHGSSFVMVAQFTGGCPVARSILTYSQSENPASPYFADQTRMFSRKEWKPMLFCENEILADPGLRVAEVGCAATAGFRSAAVVARRQGARFSFSSRQGGQVTVDVLRAAQATRVGANRRVARFRRARSFNWNGRVKGRALPDGYYFVRYSVRTRDGRTDVRDVPFRVRRGRILPLSAFSQRAGCGLLRSFELGGPAFGGRSNRALAVSFRLDRRASVTVELFRGSKRVKRVGARSFAGGRTQRLRFASRRLRTGGYRVRLSARAGTARASATLFAARL